MRLTLLQMQDKANEFKETFKDASDERSEAQEYWLEFFKILVLKKER